MLEEMVAKVGPVDGEEVQMVGEVVQLQ